jgi:hypothetical protein
MLLIKELEGKAEPEADFLWELLSDDCAIAFQSSRPPMPSF